MGRIYDSIDEKLSAWILEQNLFFTATAPLAENGTINLSPKGLDSFRILGPRQVAYLDLTGSSAETIAHVRENGRIVLMFCAFSGAPKIVRLHGRAEVISRSHAEWDSWLSQFPTLPAPRAVIVINVTRISDSCGYGVPCMEFVEERQTMARWAESKGENGLPAYRLEKNCKSIDGLPALESHET